MAKSKYDRNVDKGAAQQRNPSQGTTGGYNKPVATDEETMGSGQQSSGGSKHQGGQHKRGQGQSGGSSGRNKHGGGNG
ncbi:MAG: hypothetical protein AB7U82_17325 [Blastocatellales bacterium]